MENRTFVDPLSGSVIASHRGTPVETEVMDTVVSGNIFTEREHETTVLYGTVNFVVESVRPNAGFLAFMEQVSAELDSPQGQAALLDRVSGLPEADRDAAISGAKDAAMVAAAKEYPASSASIIRQRMDNIPIASAVEIADVIRKSGIKGCNKAADLFSALTSVPKDAWV